MAIDELDTLRKAAEGLLYPSETDAPFVPFRWPGKSSTSARDAVATRSKGKPIEETSVEAFFSALADSDDAERFGGLRAVLEKSLRGPTVLRVGEVKVAVYLIGRSAGGDWIGLRTESVET